jgi:translocation and assembly module TamA
VWGPYGFAVFFDTGNAFNSWFPHLKSGAGVGFRWKSPFGIVRLDLAHPLDNSTPVRIHFSFGPDL